MKAFSTIPNDTRFNDLWGMHNTGQTGGTPDADIDAPEAWDISTGSSEVVVAVIDTGVDYHHVDLADNMWVNEPEYNGTPGVDDDENGYIDDIYGYDFRNNDGDPMDDHYHGTHCAGTIGAVGNNNEGVAGVCWDVRIMAVKFLSSGGSGSTEDAISCVQYTTLMGANLSSNSWGGGGYSQGLKDAIDAAGAAGMIFVASAGNSSENTDVHPHYPSSYDSESLISVMSTNHNDSKSGFSNWGPVSVDLGAPGSDILSCQLGGGYKYASGTSMAGPHVAGACALLWSMNLAMTNAEVKDILIRTVDPTLPGSCVSEGRLNLYNAILEARAPWIYIEPEEGTIGAGDSCDVSVTFDAVRMDPGLYEAEIVIFSTDPCRPQTAVPVTMTVSQDDLQVSPNEDFESSGIKWGPFEPRCMSYTLRNIGDAAVSWTTYWTAEWLSIEPNEGVLDPNESVDVNVCILPAADVLDPNIYIDDVIFQNLDSNSIKPRLATLIVKPPDMFTESFQAGGDLRALSLTFMPDGSVAYYEACRDRTREFPTDPNGGAYVALWDDDFVEVVLAEGKQLLFYGQWYDRFYIGSNGYITFGDGDIEFSVSLQTHFNLPRISGLFTDLDPPHDECISYKQLQDRIAVTFDDVPLFGDKTGLNSFQIEMFFADGTICITWLELAETPCVVGLSEGIGLPPVFFEESDLSRYAPCWPLGDADRDYYVNFKDYAWLALYWRDDECGIPYWCGRTDFDRSGATDWSDVGIIADNWLVSDEWWLRPLAHWKLDETSGIVAGDSSDNGHDGTLSGGMSFDNDSVPGPVDGALQFDGINDYINVPDLSVPTEALTFALWIRPGVDLNTSSDRMELLHWGDPIQRPHLTFNMDGDGKIKLHVKIDGQGYNDVQTMTAAWQASTWYHIAVTFDGTDFHVYVDGGLENTVSHPGTHTATSELYIGSHRMTNLNWDGAMDDVRIYERALSASEIRALFWEGLGPKAYNPYPPDGAIGVDPNLALSWSPGKDALSHDVYFGIDYNDVNDANSNSIVYMGNQDTNDWDPCGLEDDTTYYWRIDENSVEGLAKGNVWSFTTWSEHGLGWWRLDETSGTVARDSSGNGHDGNLRGGMSFDNNSVPGPVNNALQFDGINDYINVPTISAPTQALTMSLWIRPDTDLNAASGRMELLHWGDPIQRPHLTFNRFADGKITLHVTIDGLPYNDVQTATDSWTASTWYHIVVAFDGTDFNVYVDGDLENTVTHPGTHAPTSNLYIGAHRQGNLCWDGAMDDVKIYDRALTAAEIQQFYQQ